MVAYNEKPCRRCLLKDLDKSEYFNSIYEYIESISPENKASEELYSKRLGICQKCDQLINGMCQKCGCFVEVRAIVYKNYCPHIERFW